MCPLLDSVCTALPRLSSQSKLLPIKAKTCYKGKVINMYGCLTPEKILNALRWLKIHNPLYANVEIIEEWGLYAKN